MMGGRMNTDNLRAEFARNRKNQKEIAKLLGISEKTLISRMRNGDFRLTEVEVLIRELHIEDPMRVFF